MLVLAFSFWKDFLLFETQIGSKTGSLGSFHQVQVFAEKCSYLLKKFGCVFQNIRHLAAFSRFLGRLRQVQLFSSLFFLKFLENRDISLTKFGSAMLLLVLSEKQRDSLDLVFYSKLFLLSEKIRSMITMTQTLKHCQLLEECSLQFQEKETILQTQFSSKTVFFVFFQFGQDLVAIARQINLFLDLDWF